MEKLFGTIRKIGNKRVINLRYTDMELYARVIRFLHTQGYKINQDFVVHEYYTKKSGKTAKIEAIILDTDIFLIMSIKQRRISEIALMRAKQLEHVVATKNDF